MVYGGKNIALWSLVSWGGYQKRMWEKFMFTNDHLMGVEQREKKEAKGPFSSLLLLRLYYLKNDTSLSNTVG